MEYESYGTDVFIGAGFTPFAIWGNPFEAHDNEKILYRIIVISELTTT